MLSDTPYECTICGVKTCGHVGELIRDLSGEADTAADLRDALRDLLSLAEPFLAGRITLKGDSIIARARNLIK